MKHDCQHIFCDLTCVPTAASGEDGVDKNRLTGSCQNQTLSELRRPKKDVGTRLPAEHDHGSTLNKLSWATRSTEIEVRLTMCHPTGFIKLNILRCFDFDVSNVRCKQTEYY